MTVPVQSYVIPSPHFGWLAVAEIPAERTKWFFPPRHTRWRPSKRFAVRAIPKARKALAKDLAQREAGVARDRAREKQREDAGRRLREGVL